MDLPQSGNEESKVMDDLVHRKILIRELLLLRKIIIQRCPKLRSTAIEHGLAIKHPLLLRDIIIPNTACMRIDPGEQFSMDRKILVRRKAESTFGEKCCDPRGNLVRLLCAVRCITGRIFLVIRPQEFICLFKCYLALDIPDSRPHQIFRCLEPINRLQANGRMPSIAFVPLVRLGLLDIFLKWIFVHVAPPHYFLIC